VLASRIGQEESKCHGHAHKMTTTQQEGTREAEEEQKPSMSQAAANNNHNSQRFLDGIVNHRDAESAVFCWSKATPEVLGMAGQFPVGPGINWSSSCPMNHAQGNGSMGICQPHFQARQSEKFPIYLNLKLNRGFPLYQWDVSNSYQLKPEILTNTSETEIFSPYQAYAPSTASFPIQQVYVPWHLNFPQLMQLPRKNSDGAFPEISTTMTRRCGQVATSSPAEQAPQEFPIIKKRFVSFPNYRAMPQDGPHRHPHPNPPTAATTTTMTQPGLAKVTKIDEISGGEGGGAGTRVHKVPPMFDNELEAEEQTTEAEEALNLNVAREIEHQQAENLNDAFGERRHDHSHKNDDAITITMGEAKNKREICEQSKLEKAEDHNEPNMRDFGEQQSICLAREQTIDGHQIGNGNRNSNHQQSGDLSDVRQSSPEQLDGNLGRQLTRERNPNPNPSPCPNRTLPNIELLKSSVRVFLAERNWDWDWELLDLLTDAIELICGQPKEQQEQLQETGNLWSESPVAGADMTVSKVSEERETETTVDVYPAEQLDHQPAEQADDNNNSSIIEATLPSEMKYELKTASPALPSRRSPQTESPVVKVEEQALVYIRCRRCLIMNSRPRSKRRWRRRH